MRRPTPRSAALALVGLFIAVQFVPIRRDNPPTARPLTPPAPVQSILARSCADCHSHDTIWPWYSYVAPVSWLIARDVHEGRRHLNFSDWEQYSSADRWKKLALLSTAVQDGEMPLRLYISLHPAARLSPDDVGTLSVWADGGGEEAP